MSWKNYNGLAKISTHALFEPLSKSLKPFASIKLLKFSQGRVQLGIQ